MKIKVGILLTAAFVGCFATSHGQTTTWTQATNPTWGTVGNWSSGVPGAGTTAIVDNAGTSTSLGLDRSIGAFSSIRTTGNFIITMSGSLSTSGNFSIAASAGEFVLRGAGGVSVLGDLNVAGTLRLGDSGQPSIGVNSQIGNVSVAGITNLSSNLAISNLVTSSGTSTVNLGSLAMNTGGVLNLTAGNSANNGTATGDTNLVTVNRLSGAAGTIQANKAATTGHLAVSGTVNGSYAGTIVNGLGTVQLTKSGSSTLTLTGSNSYTGATAVNAGTLLINGSLGNTAVAVGSTGILGGSGTISGALTVNAGGQIAPGNSPGRLTVANSVTIATGGATGFELNGATVATEYDQLRITGGASVFSLTGTNNLVLSLGYTPAADALFFLVDNQGSSAISGVFEQLNGATTSLIQDAVFTLGAQQFKIGYAGDVGTNSFTGGNDLVLQAVPEPSTWGLLAGGLTMLMFLRRRRAW